MDAATPVAIRLRRSIPEHDAYTVHLADQSFAVLVTARPADARRWVSTTRWLHHLLLHHGRLVVGLGVQWTPTGCPLGGVPPVPDTLQLSVGHRCLAFHLAHASAVPEALRRFLADPRVTFVGSGSANDRRILQVHHGIHVACGRELRAMAGMGNASMEEMAARLLGYPGITKPQNVAVSAWHAPRLSADQVLYAAVDAYLAFRLGVHLCPDGAAVAANQPDLQAPRDRRRPAPALPNPAPPAKRARVLEDSAFPPFHPGPAVLTRPAPSERVELSPPAFCGVATMAYARDDDDYNSWSWDGFEHVRPYEFADEEEEDEDDSLGQDDWSDHQEDYGRDDDDDLYGEEDEDDWNDHQESYGRDDGDLYGEEDEDDGLGEDDWNVHQEDYGYDDDLYGEDHF